MNPLLRHWQRFWFKPVPADNLGLCRLLFYALVLILYLPEDLSAWGDAPRALWFPTTLFKRIPFAVPGVSTLSGVELVWKLALLASAAGLVTRLSTIVSFVLGFYLLGLPHNFGKVHHFDAMIVLILGLLAASRAGDAWSLDRRIARARGTAAPPAASGEYRWPVRGAWVVMALVFFAAGFSKLRHGGLAWMFSDNMATLLLQHGYQVSNENPATSWGLWLAEYPKLASVLATSTVVIETGYPLALFNRRARWFFPPAMCGALVGIRLLMGPTFPQFLICHLFWIPWDQVLDFVSRRLGARRTSRELAGPA